MTDLLPGTQEAIDGGCLCPIMDNGHGRGYMGQPGVYVYAGNCSHHGHIVQAAMTEKQVPVSAAGDISHAANSLDIDRLKAAAIAACEGEDSDENDRWARAGEDLMDPVTNARVAVRVRELRGRFGGAGGWTCADLGRVH